MALFFKSKDKPAPVALPPLPAQDEDAVLDALGGIVRDYGEHGFDIEPRTAQELADICEAWATHALTGTPPPGDELAVTDADSTPVASVPMGERQFGALRQFLGAHRQHEQTHVRESADNMRDLVAEVVNGLRVAIADDTAKDELVSSAMTALNEHAETSSIEQIRTELARTMTVVSGVIRERQQRYETQLASMSEQVQSLRSNLLDVRQKAELDALTQTNNRGAFDAMLAQQADYAFLTGEPLALLLMDLDHFKAVNDSYGHAGGDEVLRVAANALVRAFPRRSDFVARYGGEEFAVILSNVDESGLSGLGERALNAVRQAQVEYQGDTIRITCSVGLALFASADDPAGLIERADKALYAAKHAGRDRAVIDAPR